MGNENRSLSPDGNEQRKMATAIATGPASRGPCLNPLEPPSLFGVDVSGAACVAVLGVVEAVEFKKMAASGELGDRLSSSAKKIEGNEE